MKVRSALLLLSPLVGLGVVVFISLHTGASLARVTGLVPLPNQLAALAAFLLSLLGRGGRIALLARGLGTRLTLSGAVATQLTGEAAAAATPSRSGSDPVRLLFLRKLGVDLPTGMAIIVGEIMAEGIALSLVILVLLVLLPGSTAVVLGALPYALTALAMPFLAFFLARRRGGRQPPAWWVRLKLRPLQWRKLRAGARRFRWKGRELARLKSRTVAAVVLVSLVHILARLSILPLLTLGVRPDAPLEPLTAWPLLLLYTGSLLPPPGGGGAVELSFVAGLESTLGPGSLAGLLLWWRLYTFYLGALAGALVLILGLGKAGVAAMRRGRTAPRPDEKGGGNPSTRDRLSEQARTVHGIFPG